MTKKCWRCGNEMMATGGKRQDIPFLISKELPPAVVTVDVCSEYCARQASAAVCKNVANVIGSYGEMVLRMDDIQREVAMIKKATVEEEGGSIWTRKLPGWVDHVVGIGLIATIAIGWVVLL